MKDDNVLEIFGLFQSGSTLVVLPNSSSVMPLNRGASAYIVQCLGLAFDGSTECWTRYLRLVPTSTEWSDAVRLAAGKLSENEQQITISNSMSLAPVWVTPPPEVSQ